MVCAPGIGAGGGIYLGSWIVDSYSTIHMFQCGVVLEILSLVIVGLIVWRGRHESV